MVKPSDTPLTEHEVRRRMAGATAVTRGDLWIMLQTLQTYYGRESQPSTGEAVWAVMAALDERWTGPHIDAQDYPF